MSRQCAYNLPVLSWLIVAFIKNGMSEYSIVGLTVAQCVNSLQVLICIPVYAYFRGQRNLLHWTFTKESILIWRAGILVELLLPQQISYTYTHSSHFQTEVKRVCINMLNHFNQMFLRRRLITMNALINGTLMTTLILNGSNRIQCILSSGYILNIVKCETSTMHKPYHRC